MELVLQLIRSFSKNDRLNESELIRMGNRRSFEAFYDRYKISLLSYVVGIISKQEVAEEIVQESFLRLYRLREQIDPTLSLKSWIYTIARNLSYDYLKKKKEVSCFLDSDDEGTLPWEDFPSNEENVEMKLVHRSDREELFNVIQSLPLAQKEAVAFWLEELNYEEMALITKKSAQAMKNLVHRARQTIFAALKSKQGESNEY